MEVVISFSKDKREEAIFVLKEMMVAYLQMKRTRGGQNGECRD